MARRKFTRRPDSSHSGRPFGSPDGSNANLQELLHEFVEFRGRAPDDPLAAKPADHKTRVVVGKMGVGKTVYLRRFRAAANEDDAMYADEVRHDVPPTEDVIELCQQFKPALVEEIWARVWRRAMLRAALSHILCHPLLKGREEAIALREVAPEYKHLVPACKTPRSIYSELGSIVARYRTRDQLRRYVKDSDWGDLEWHVAEALKTLPPLCFYLDSVDDKFSSAPMFWLKLQKGLVTQVLALMREDGFRRLHVVVAVRDIVLSSMLRDEHAGRYRNEEHIRVLDWDLAAIQYFLHEKIRRLPARYRLKPDADHPIEEWLGKTTFYNDARKTNEDLEDYLLRHTRLIPRDIVNIGNLLSREVAQAKQAGEKELSDEAVKRVVDQAARGFCDQQLQVCANQIAADMIPERGGPDGYSDFYVGTDEYRQGIAQLLRKMVATIGNDRVTYDELQDAAEALGEELSPHEHVLDVLWQNGLLGYDAEDGACSHTHFYAATAVDDFNLPQGRNTYVFHPCLAHSVKLEPVGGPVRGYRTP